ncbi:MAG: sulfite exporter TauE/SafE family protein [Candidatus Omnitrophica bacterium]|nr:sulfite exporter TauE/SafE family protein [Candidatus Omnitrophota bacterium]
MIKISLSMFLSGFLFGSGPCLASCGPFLISFIAATNKNIPQAIKFYSFFSLSRVAVYLVLGLLIYYLGIMVQEYLFPGYVSLFGGIFIVLCGLFIILGKKLKLPWISRFNKFPPQNQLKNPFVFGLIYGLIPCVPFLTVLSYCGLVSRNWSQALFFTFCFGLGTYLSPLLVVSVFSGAISGFLKGASEKYLKVISVLCGLIIIFLGLQLAKRGF